MFLSKTSIAIDERGLLVQVGPEKKVLVSLRDVRKDYVMGDNIIHVLQGINLDIYENEFLVVLGESGCGKSTMLNIIGGMDFTTGQEILMVIENIIREKNTTVVMITHNVEIAKMANRVVKLKNGKVSSIKTNMHPMAAAEIVW